MSNLSLPDLPALSGALDSRKERRQIVEYLYQLTEQLKYVLGHLGEENFSEGVLEQLQNDEAVGEIRQRLEDTQAGTATLRRQTAAGFAQQAQQLTQAETRLQEADSALGERVQTARQQLTTLQEQTAEGFTQQARRVTQVETDLSGAQELLTQTRQEAATFAQQTADGFAQQAQKLTETGEAVESLRTQTAEGFEQMVRKDGVLSAINQSAEQVQIQAGKISLKGYATVNDYFQIDEAGRFYARRGGQIAGFQIGPDGLSSEPLSINAQTGQIDMGNAASFYGLGGSTMTTQGLILHAPFGVTIDAPSIRLNGVITDAQGREITGAYG